MEKLKQLALDIEQLEQQYSRLGWTQYTTGYDFGTEEQFKKIMDKYSSEKDFEMIKKLNERTDLSFEDKRRVEIMYSEFEPFHLSKEVNELSAKMQALTTKLSQVLNTFRSKINGVEISSVEIDQILRNDDNEERRKEAFLARTQINKPLVDAGFIELLNLRKEYAKLRGFKDFVAMKLSDNDLNTEIFADWKDQLHAILPEMQSKRAEVAKKYLNKEVIKPWDEAYLVSKLAPSLSINVDMSEYYNILRDFFINFGFDISKYNITYDIFPRANKSEWGYNFPIATGKDSRILANVKNQYSEFRVLLHETGHGIHSFLQDPNETILNGGISGIISEGIANLFGSFIYEEIFYKRFFNDTTRVKEELSTYRDYSRVNTLRAIPNIMFDQSLYRTDIKTLDDINNLAFAVTKDYMNEDAFAEQYPWGYRIHHTTHPIYLHNYFMGDVTCEMLKKNFVEKYSCNKIIDKPLEFGQYLYESVVKPSGLYKYPELFKRISGESFSLKYML